MMSANQRICFWHSTTHCWRGASTEIQSAAMEQLSQSYAKGKMDMEEWRSLQTAMPAQLNQVAQAMGMSADELGEGLRTGTISMDEFMDMIMKLNTEGTGAFASFEEQAKSATGGIGTQLQNMKTAVTRGLPTCLTPLAKIPSVRLSQELTVS
ncbi:tape measure protein [Eubacterium limosum]